MKQSLIENSIEPLIYNAWYIAAWSDELTDQIIGRTFLNQSVVIFRDDNGNVSALEDRCCHRGAPLTHGKRVKGGLECGYHGLIFNASGKCIEIPGQDNIPDEACVKAYPVVEKQHFIWIWMGDNKQADESKIIDFPYFSEQHLCPSKKGVMEIKANYMMGIDNLMDLTHVGYVHHETIGGGDPKAHSNADMKVTFTDRGVLMERWMLNCVPPPTFSRSVNFVGNIDRWQEFEFVPPSSVLQWSGGIDVGKKAIENRNQEGFHFRIVHSLTPKSESSYYYFFGIGHHHRVDDRQVTEDLYQENVDTFVEDTVIIEAQQKRLKEMPDRNLVTIKNDEAIVKCHTALRRFANGEKIN
ncbi:MAG: Rieske 2Fe-2S domain-containing protein [Rhodospirillales bacterium]|tara:strand:- start:991 stop:2055 length:1065 start_codon:yes stop_codon:yes gene_type:complete